MVTFGGCEVAAYAFGGLITSKIGIKASYFGSFSLSVGATVCYLLSTDPEMMPLVLAAAGFGIVWACNVNWNGNAVFFPVIYASSTNGICNLFGRLASIIAP